MFVLSDSCGHRTKRYCESLESASVGDFKSQQLPHLPVVYCLRICLQPKLSKWPSVTPAKLRCFTVSVQVQDLYNTIICSWKYLIHWCFSLHLKSEGSVLHALCSVYDKMFIIEEFSWKTKSHIVQIKTYFQVDRLLSGIWTRGGSMKIPKISKRYSVPTTF